MSDLTLVIGNKNYSSWSLRPWLYLKHFQIPFTEVRIALDVPGFKEKILEHSPAGKVPILKEKEWFVWDSLAIMEYLAEKYPEKKGWPEDMNIRAIGRSISAEMHSSFFALREHMPMNCRRIYKGFIPPESALVDINRVKTIWTNCRTQFGANGPWLCGEFSIADCMYAPVVMRFHTYSISLDGSLQEYVNTVKNHPAMVEWMNASHAEKEVIETAEFNP